MFLSQRVISHWTGSNSTSLHVHFPGGLRGASIIDSLDTLYIMGMTDEYNDAKEWVKTNLDLNSVRSPFFILTWTLFLFQTMQTFTLTSWTLYQYQEHFESDLASR